MRSSFLIVSVFLALSSVVMTAPAPQESVVPATTAETPATGDDGTGGDTTGDAAGPDGTTTTTEDPNGFEDFGDAGASPIDATDLQDSILDSLARDNSTSNGNGATGSTTTPDAGSIASAESVYGRGGLQLPSTTAAVAAATRRA